MKTTFTNRYLLFAVLVLFTTGCSSSYHAINPENVSFSAKTESNNVELQYKYDVLAEAGNKKYAKREKKSLVQVVAVKYTNNTDRIIDLSKDVHLTAAAIKFTPLTPVLAHRQLKQEVPLYLLYLLSAPVQLPAKQKYENGKVVEKAEPLPIGLFLGPGLSIYNIFKASTANKRFLEELKRYDVSNHKLMPGESVFGLIPIANSGYAPLSIKTEELSAQSN